jgi:hypothetical protein
MKKYMQFFHFGEFLQDLNGRSIRTNIAFDHHKDGSRMKKKGKVCPEVTRDTFYRKGWLTDECRTKSDFCEKLFLR